MNRNQAKFSAKNLQLESYLSRSLPELEVARELLGPKSKLLKIRSFLIQTPSIKPASLVFATLWSQTFCTTESL